MDAASDSGYARIGSPPSGFAPSTSPTPTYLLAEQSSEYDQGLEDRTSDLQPERTGDSRNAVSQTAAAGRPDGSGTAGSTEPSEVGAAVARAARGRTRTTGDAQRMSELGRLSAQARRERKRQREEAATNRHLTYRQRIGVALSQLTQEQLNTHVQALSNLAAQGDAKSIHALARLSDQAFGRSQPEVQDDGRDILEKQWSELTVSEKAALRAEAIERIRAHERAAGDSSDPREASG